MGSLVAVDTGTSAEARRARRERRKCIRNGTATESDFDAEIDAQERELLAAVEERKQIDSKLEAADADKKKYEKELDNCRQNLAAARSPAVIAELERKMKALDADIDVERRKERQYLEERGPLVARIKELGADISRLERQARAWHAYTFSLVWQPGPLSPSSLFVCIFSPQRPSQHDSIVRTQHTHSQLCWPASLFARHRIFSAVFTEE